MALNRSRTTRQKVFSSRSRTGCRTCKLRHIKCDETLGSCNNCTSTGRTCDGSDHHLIIMNQKRLPAGPGTHALNSNLPWISPSERRYLTFFQSYTLPMLVGYFDSELWQILVLQLSQVEPAVCHAVAALGALHEFVEVQGMRARDLKYKGWCRNFALYQYNRAILMLRQRLGSNDPQLRLVTLSCCMIFIFFEFTWGNYGAALTHLKCGLNILANREGSVGRSFVCASLYCHQHNPSSAEDTLVRAFAHLDVQAVHFDSSCNTSFYPAKVYMSTVQSRHLELKNLQDAKEKLDPIINNIFCFRTICDTTLRDKSANHLPLYVEHQKLRLNLIDHIAAFDRYIDCFPPRTIKELRSVDLIRLHHSLITLVLETVLSLSEMVFDKYIMEMSKSVDLCERVINSLRAEHGNTLPTILMDMGVILVLSWLSLKCREFKVRYRALELLRSWPHREGPNESTKFLYSCAEAVKIESEGVDQSGYLPERSRVRAISTQNLGDGKAVLHYTMSAPDKARLDIHKRVFTMRDGHWERKDDTPGDPDMIGEKPSGQGGSKWNDFGLATSRSEE
ncbi:Zn(II)2Cys6 transcription factor [Aspergillus alliaceus]|uniref:Zn(II)2Cys6 transcription factor n=1 Tax=Petromyces alliaceus TaxID=209559 RepID=UPI0012A58E95|nr:uncharacterized protein BDW43DRAFT_287920 [Aspergillus alliaceus]KAB8229584.1 hypothetical protein BDW43DRAFT_287920 [Aspergillus alliaceus]